MLIPALGVWGGAGVALAVALAAALGCRALRWPRLGAAAAGLGLAAGWGVLLGIGIASPRQMIERLPLLAIGLAAAGLLLAPLGRVGWVGVGLGVAAAAWWLAGAPLAPEDLRRAAVLLVVLAVAGAMLALALDGRAAVVAAPGLALAGIALAAPPGPWLPLAACIAAAAVGGLAAGATLPAGSRLPLAGALVAVAAGPILARGAPVDWLAAAAAPAALWLGPALAARLGLPPAVAWALAGGAPLALAWALRA